MCLCLHILQWIKNLSSFRWQVDKGFRLIRDFKILPTLTTGYYSFGEYDETLKPVRQQIENATALHPFRCVV
ncbi:MAG: hypothetical protein ACJAVI_002569 [Candidatus Azotimanducaceae bacterium]|jgi:hypothetical protein